MQPIIAILEFAFGTIVLVAPGSNPVKNNSFFHKNFLIAGYFCTSKSPRPAVEKFELMNNSHMVNSTMCRYGRVRGLLGRDEI